ncbi:MAG: YoaK family protein [Lysobacteraceae bacterium]
MKRIGLPDLLTFNGGYVDAAGFIALHGLFTAHVTGNFVTIGASLVNGTAGIVGKLLVLPVFCLVALLARATSQRLAASGGDAVRALLLASVAMLTMAAAIAWVAGPFAVDSAGEIATGMTLVVAMAIQNVLHRVHFPKAPPPTLMTGSATQMMIDLADLWRGGLAPDARAALRARSATLGRAVAIFAAGCGLAALAYLAIGLKAFVLPPVIVALGMLPAFRLTQETRA